MPHPSWRNNAWLKRNPWFEEDLLPVLKKPLRALGLLLESGFSAAGLERRLEYRAQLVCLTAVDDPRVGQEAREVGI